MKYSTFVFTALLTTVLARSDVNEGNLKARTHPRDVRSPQGAFVRARWNTQLGRREVPQEHSHEKFLTSVRTSLNLNNPDQIADPVFGLLGNAAAAQGAGNIADTECLQQATADQAFTNAKAAGDVTGMTDALVYRALERNTGQVGLASNSCTTVTAVNPGISTLQQHQDPASNNAAATNKQITLTLAIQIASIGGDPTIALQSGTFAPGQVGDPTAAGNTCDDQNDPEGCIFTQNLLVEDATVDEINAAVAAGSAGSTGVAGVAASNATILASDSSFAAQFVPASTNAPASIQTVADQALSTIMITQTVTACVTTAAPPVGMTAITMPTADASSVISIAISLGIQINVESSDSSVVNKDQVQTGTTVASARVTDAVAAASTSVYCSGAISSALAAAGLGGADALTGTSAATATVSSVGATTAAATAAASASTASSNATSTSALDLGSCPNPTIIFADNLDGRNEPSFAPADEATFTHGSALGIKVITDFVCQQLDVKCKASAPTIDACNQGATAAQGQTGHAAADAFNAALGF